MTDHEKLLLKTVPLYMVVFVAAMLGVDAFAGGMSVYLMAGIAGGAVAILASGIELRHARRTIAARGEGFQRAVRDLDDEISKGSS